MSTIDLALPLDRLTAVGLDDLNSRAARLTRVDRKYLLPLDDVATLLADLPVAVAALEIDGRRTFGYESEYLDTPELNSFALTARRRRRRYKVRTRTYLDTGESWLEVKTRGPRGTSVKVRRQRGSGAASRLTSAERYFVADTLRDAGVDPAPVPSLAPVLLTRYRRATLHLPDDDARATIDTNLAWTDADGHHRDAPDIAVVETKTASTASAVDRLLWAHGHRPTAVSKFATGLALLHPDLPANRWHRTVRRLDDAHRPH
ncbi:VTC domain-containing protein [Georgenia satyanarayanai]|uniref:VTC domain-containing protein n=1 Tax=Georgenia satyanarayanai TaxID=860221 RepID=A0A2Y8ZXF7_9MICO|nr:polyphosphate polymerase domain-containing protein [Georgenia satyanarayanai]PYG02179.1 VTC domain-containing protein [Georgenia satyanarayanai]SSA37001.1 VTC domain-containing protein [Georgenia satyanarayanai]